MREDRHRENAGFHLAGELPRYLAFLDSQGVDSDAVLERSGVLPEIVETPDALIPAQVAYGFVEQACLAAETERMGLSVALQTDLAEVSALGVPLLNARTVWEYLLIACQVANRPLHALNFSLVQGRNRLLRVSFRRRVPPGLGSHQSDLETAALTIKRWREALGHEWRPTRINFAYPARCPLDGCEVFAGSQIVNSGSTSWMEFPLEDSLKIFPRRSRAADEQEAGNAADAPLPEALVDRIKLQIMGLKL